MSEARYLILARYLKRSEIHQRSERLERSEIFERSKVLLCFDLPERSEFLERSDLPAGSLKKMIRRRLYLRILLCYGKLMTKFLKNISKGDPEPRRNNDELRSQNFLPNQDAAR